MSEEMTFLDHIEELRWRIVKIIVGMIVPIVAAMTYYEDIFLILQMPIKDTLILQDLLSKIGLESIIPVANKEISLQAINPTDTFLTAIKVSITVGIFVSFPNTIFQIWRFVSPALSSAEKSYTFPVVIFATLFFLVGGSFAYFIVTPFSFNFLANFGSDLVANQWGVSQYYDLILQLLLMFGLIFELPCIAYVLARIGILKPQFLRNYRRFAVVIILVLSSILTPPDVVSQIMMGVPLYGLYELSIVIVSVFRKKSPFDED